MLLQRPWEMWERTSAATEDLRALVQDVRAALEHRSRELDTRAGELEVKSTDLAVRQKELETLLADARRDHHEVRQLLEQLGYERELLAARAARLAEQQELLALRERAVADQEAVLARQRPQRGAAPQPVAVVPSPWVPSAVPAAHAVESVMARISGPDGQVQFVEAKVSWHGGTQIFEESDLDEPASAITAPAVFEVTPNLPDAKGEVLTGS